MIISAFGTILTGILTLAAQNFSGNYMGSINETETVTLSLNMQQQDVYYIEDGKMLITGADGTKMLYYKD